MRPADNPSLKPVISFSYQDSPAAGLQLAASIVSSIDHLWRDTSNRPITDPVAERLEPFEQFDFHVSPSMRRGPELTPVKVGLGYCWILNGLTQQQLWPGHIRAILYEGIDQQKKWIGSMNVDHDGEVAGTDPAGRDTDGNSGLSSPGTPQRWLKCFQKVMLLSVVHSPLDRVTDTPVLSPKPVAHKYSWPCGSVGVADRVDFFIYPAANAGSPHQLTWEKLMSQLVPWLIRVASDRDRAGLVQFHENGVLLAEMTVFIQPGAGGNRWNNEAAATA
ncbi:MAG: hypothetical protein L6R40_006180 [Gallowayella cf. fulva]|nr:MAG: hypothetical protein L6R40_006180 [Xanthomendoza cf. fulva]